MSRKLLAEVDKLTKDVNANIESYDTRWQELKDFNRSQLGLKERMWEEARREQIRGKKHAVRTATLELLDFKHVCDSKGRIESELETILRRLHRHKQQLAEWMCLPELRQQADELRDLRKQVELRYKRGRVFYCRGESSEGPSGFDTGGETAEVSPTAASQIEWVEKFLSELQRQRAEFEGELQSLGSPLSRRRKPSQARQARDSRRTQLETFLELHATHCEQLERILIALTSRGYEIPGDQAMDLRDQLHQYVENNDNLEYVVAEDIYMELTLPSGSVESASESSCSSSSASSESVRDDQMLAENPISSSADGQSCSTTPLTSSRIAEPLDAAKLQSPDRIECGNSEAAETKADTREYLTASTTAQRRQPPPPPSKRLQEIVCIDSAVCNWSFHSSSTPDRTLALTAGDVLYIVKVDKSGWSYAFKAASSGKLQRKVPKIEPREWADLDVSENQQSYHKALSPQGTHIDSSDPDLVSGWFPNHVRKTVHDWTLDQASTTASEASAIVTAANGSESQPEVNLMERLQTLQTEEAQICNANLTWLLSSLTAHIKPQTLGVVQWDWSQTWETGNSSTTVRYLDVCKGDRVWVLRVSAGSNWVEVRKLNSWECVNAGWVPATNLISPREIVENMILLDNMTAPLTSRVQQQQQQPSPLYCYEHKARPSRRLLR